MGSIANKLNSLGLHLKHWSDDELEILRKYYPEEGRNGVAKRLGRTPTACAHKAHALGIDNGSNK